MTKKTKPHKKPLQVGRFGWVDPNPPPPPKPLTPAEKKQRAADAKAEADRKAGRPNIDSRFPRIIMPVNPLDAIKTQQAAQVALKKLITPKFSSENNVASSGDFVVSKLNVLQTPAGTGYKPAGHYYSIAIDFAVGNQKMLKAHTVPGGAITWSTFPGGLPGAPDPPWDIVDTDTGKQEWEDSWGEDWGNPLVDPHTNSIYLMRVRLDQFKAEPLLSGFILRFVLPTGWRFVDGFGTTYTLQAVSNPTVLVRVMLSPPTLKPGAHGGFICAVKKMIPGSVRSG